MNEKKRERRTMKKYLSILFIFVMILTLVSCADKNPEGEKEQTQAEQLSTDDGWILPETIEMTKEISGLFTKAVEGITDVNYEPQGYLGEKDGVYCILCRACAVQPEAKPYYALVYVSDKGVQNVWDIWMGAHAEKK